MKVSIKPKTKRIDSYIGDIIQFDGNACMVIDCGFESNFYGVLCLEGYNAGKVVEKFERLSQIDEDSRTTEVLIKKADVIISKEEGVE